MIENRNGSNKKIGLAVFVMACIMLLPGCGMKELTDAETKVIASYAADVLIHYDARYYTRFAEEDNLSHEETAESKATPEPEVSEPVVADASQNEEEPQAEKPVGDTTGSSEQNPVVQEDIPHQENMSPMRVGEIFGLKDVEISYTGYEETEKYPIVEANQLAFQFEAVDNAKLLVFSFNLVNSSNEARTCNIIGQNVKFRINVNDSENIAVQKTPLADDLSRINAVLQPHESKKAVVVCQVPSDYSTQISSLSIIVRIGGEDYTIKLQ